MKKSHFDTCSIYLYIFSTYVHLRIYVDVLLSLTYTYPEHTAVFMSRNVMRLQQLVIKAAEFL